MNWLFGSPAAVLEVSLVETAGRKQRRIDFGEEEVSECFVYADDEPVRAKAVLTAPSGSPPEHEGVVAEMRGVVELYPDRGNPRAICKERRVLIPPGKTGGRHEFDLEFTKPREFDTYSGVNVRIRYFVTVSMLRSGISGDISKSVEFCVENTSPPPSPSPSPRIRMEVGIEGFLHIEFEYDRSAYHLEDVVTGAVHFCLVKIPVKHMEVAILRRESCTAAGMVYSESDTLGKFEIMDGAPIKGEVIPIRVFLHPYQIGPSAELEGAFQVRYFISLVLVDEDDRRYFKQHEIKLWRRAGGAGGEHPKPPASIRALARDQDTSFSSPEEEGGGEGGEGGEEKGERGKEGGEEGEKTKTKTAKEDEGGEAKGGGGSRGEQTTL